MECEKLKSGREDRKRDESIYMERDAEGKGVCLLCVIELTPTGWV